MIQADLHLHTNYSSDAEIRPKIIVNQLFSHPTIKAVAITDHNTVRGYEEVQKLVSPHRDILVIPGVEISAEGGDIIILGVTELPPRPWSPENIIDFAREREGLTIAAHPYRACGLGDQVRKFNFDAIEVLNGISSNQANKMARKLAEDMVLPGVAGSDAHRMNEMWSVYTEVQASLDMNEILKAIKGGLATVASAKNSIHF